MAYECPVCSEVAADGSHLAHHLAVMAALGRPAHETWLDERVPDWSERAPGELAEAVTPAAEEVDVETVETVPPPDHGFSFDPPSDETVQSVLEEARELTRERDDNE